jgi:peroxiredoxin
MLLRLIACAALATFVGCAAKAAVAVAPDFTLAQVRGGSFHLRAHLAQPILLAFLQTLPDTADTPSRGEVVSVMSMATQYAPRGLTVAVIDASELANVRTSDGALLNASYDWNLNVPLLEDRAGAVARLFGVSATPTLVLVGADGQIVQRWTGLVPPAELARGVMLAFPRSER